MPSYGFSVCGYLNGLPNMGTNERFNDISNIHVQRMETSAKRAIGTYSLNNYGFLAGGRTVGIISTHEKYDNIANGYIVRNSITGRSNLNGFALNNYGFNVCGTDPIQNVGIIERYDDATDSFTIRTPATPRARLAAYNNSNYGYTSCGLTSIPPGWTGITERFDDISNTQLNRAPATARSEVSGYNIGEYGFSTGGYNTNTTERFDDIGNFHVSRNTIYPGISGTRHEICAYPMTIDTTSYGFTSGGVTGVTTLLGVTERYDDNVGIQTKRTDLSVPRSVLSGFSLVEGTTTGGDTSILNQIPIELIVASGTILVLGYIYYINTARR